MIDLMAAQRTNGRRGRPGDRGRTPGGEDFIPAVHDRHVPGDHEGRPLDSPIASLIDWPDPEAGDAAESPGAGDETGDGKPRSGPGSGR